MKANELVSLIFRNQSVLCVGLDSDINKIPSFLQKQKYAQFLFNKEIIDATIDYAIAYKLNTAFYESCGIEGWISLQKTLHYIRSLPKRVFLIADAKRSDIGNTSEQYAKTFFDPSAAGLDFDAITVSPYMGYDSIEPFLKYNDKWVILLALTSNLSSEDFQMLTLKNGKFLFEEVLTKTSKWASEDRIMYVIGATKSALLKKIRQIVPNHFLLIPGIGAQGGDLEEVLKNGLNARGGLIVNVSRSIIFASSDDKFQENAHNEAKKFQQVFKNFLSLFVNN